MLSVLQSVVLFHWVLSNPPVYGQREEGPGLIPIKALAIYALLEHSNWWTQEGVLRHVQIVVSVTPGSQYLKERKVKLLDFQ